MRQGRQAGAGAGKDLTEPPLGRARRAASVHRVRQGHAVSVVPDEGMGPGLGRGC
jgi:hypothetical protein